jgi:hypothetical protein
MTAWAWPISPVRSSLFGAVLLFSSQLALAQFTQQGPKLVGTLAVGNLVEQGISVALSADGNTAIVGGWGDNSGVGAAWVYTRSNGFWTQQANKLVGTGAVGNAQQGVSVALSADGNTAIVGGYEDNSRTGAAWVYTRSRRGGVWTQQGSKLVGTGAVLSTAQGRSVALSADGNTALVGGYVDNASTGAVWVFTRSGNVWTQQGSKLVGTGAVGNANQGISVALSANGNTAIVGGYVDPISRTKRSACLDVAYADDSELVGDNFDRKPFFFYKFFICLQCAIPQSALTAIIDDNDPARRHGSINFGQDITNRQIKINIQQAEGNRSNRPEIKLSDVGAD